MGTISLVAGGLSNRLFSGPNATRGWLNLTIASPGVVVPALAGWGVGLLTLVLIGVCVRKLRGTR